MWTIIGGRATRRRSLKLFISYVCWVMVRAAMQPVTTVDRNGRPLRATFGLPQDHR